MYTVIIQSQETARLGRDYRRLLFEEFTSTGQMDFCTWVKTGDSVETAVPKLYDLIAGKRDWRAIIVQTERDRKTEADGWGADCPDVSRDGNPFDFQENWQADPRQVKKSDVPLIRLTQMLGGVPEPEVEFVREAVEEERPAFGAEEPSDDEEQPWVTRYVYRPRRDPEAMKAHERLSREYQFVENRPREILVVSTRQPTDTTESEIDAAWRVRLESESSEFWHRNRYPSLCRFLTFDVLNERHSLYPGNIFKLWSAVLLLALNQVEASTLQAYRLYNLSVQIDQKKLNAAFSGYLSRMSAMLAQLDAADANRESLESQAAKKAPEVGREISVSFDGVQDPNLFVNTKCLGMTRDVPMDERMYWSERYWVATGAMRKLLRSPTRALDVAADDARRQSVYAPENVEILNRYQRADLEDDLEEIYFETLNARSRMSLNVKRRQQERDVINQQVYNRIAQRLNRRNAALGGLTALGVMAVSELPYLIGAGRVSGGALLWALLALLIGLAGAACFGIVEVWIQRREMADAMEDHNRCMGALVRDFQVSAHHYSDYLTALCSYLRGRSYLDQEERLRTSLANVELLREGHRRAIRKCVSLVKVWSAALGISASPELNGRSDADFDPAVPSEENPAYRLELPTGGRIVPLNETGETMFSPFDFISGITLKREELFDDVDHQDR